MLNQYETDEETGKQVRKKNPDPIYPVVTLVLYFGNIRWKRYKTLLKTVKVPKELEPYLSEYNINVFEIAWLTNEQVEKFKSDFKIVADYFVQVRTNKDYKPSPQKIKHVHEVLQLMAIFSNDNSFEEFQNLYVEGEEITMTELLDKVEARGKLDLLYKQIKKGRITLEEAASDIEMTVKQLLDCFKEYNLVL